MNSASEPSPARPVRTAVTGSTYVGPTAGLETGRRSWRREQERLAGEIADLSTRLHEATVALDQLEAQVERSGALDHLDG